MPEASSDSSAPRRPVDDDSLVDAFLEFMEVERTASPRTLANYQDALTRFVAWQPSPRPWTDCQPDDFRRYLFELMKGGMARATVRLHFAALRSFYKYLTRRCGLETNPVADVLLPKLERKPPVVLTETQMTQMLDLPFKIEQPKQAPAWVAHRDAAVLELFGKYYLPSAEPAPNPAAPEAESVDAS